MLIVFKSFDVYINGRCTAHRETIPLDETWWWVRFYPSLSVRFMWWWRIELTWLDAWINHRWKYGLIYVVLFFSFFSLTELTQVRDWVHLKPGRQLRQQDGIENDETLLLCGEELFSSLQSDKCVLCWLWITTRPFSYLHIQHLILTFFKWLR